MLILKIMYFSKNIYNIIYIVYIQLTDWNDFFFIHRGPLATPSVPARVPIFGKKSISWTYELTGHHSSKNRWFNGWIGEPIGLKNIDTKVYKNVYLTCLRQNMYVNKLFT